MEKQQNGFRWIRKMIAIWFGYASRGRAMSDARGAPNYGPGRSREPMKGAWKDLRSLLALLDLNVNPSAFAVPSGCLMLFIFWNSDCQVMVLWNMIIWSSFQAYSFRIFFLTHDTCPKKILGIGSHQVSDTSGSKLWTPVLPLCWISVHHGPWGHHFYSTLWGHHFYSGKNGVVLEITISHDVL